MPRTDNWKHKSETMLCKTCMHYVSKNSISELAKSLDDSPKGIIQAQEKGLSVGRCRKKSPCMDGWPTVFSTDWCGDHKIDGDKI